MNTLRRIAAVSAEEPYTLRVAWVDGETDRVDMTGVVQGLDLFRALRDHAAFSAVRVADWGATVEWDCGLDYSADSLAILAEEQKPMDGEDFAAWQSEMGLSINEAADLFGVAPSTIKSYKKADRLPIAWWIACRAMRKDKETFLAHYRPRIAGRPSSRGGAAP